MLKNPGKVLRELLAQPGILMAPGVYDGITATVVQQAGFKVAYQTGAGVAAGGIGEPDIGLTSATELAHACGVISNKLTLPLICDADTGFGNALNVIRTVRELERAGAAAVQIEDQVMPKRCGHLSGKECVSAAEFAAKIRAAAREKYFADTVIIARTDARAVYDFNAAIERGKMCLDAGADVLFIEAPQSIDEVEGIAKAFPGVPLLSNQVIGGKTPRLTAQELEQIGYKIVIFPDMLPFGASVLLRRLADKLFVDGCSWDIIPDAPDSRELFVTMGMNYWRELEQKYKADCGK